MAVMRGEYRFTGTPGSVQLLQRIPDMKNASLLPPEV